jgi:broad specificity phosphatase PhoE
MIESVLMIAERSGRWESCARSLCAPGHQLILLAQPEGESPHEFRMRVTHKLDRIRAHDVHLTRVILVSGAGTNSRSRARLLRTLRGKLRDRNVELTSV